MAAPQHAKVAALEKQNRDLSWQVAMLADRAAATDKGAAPAAARRAPPGSVPHATTVRMLQAARRRFPWALPVLCEVIGEPIKRLT